MTMSGRASATDQQTQAPDRSPFLSPIEHLLDWAEPLIQEAARDVWRESGARGVELADVVQEGRIAVFEAADVIAGAERPRGMVTTVVRRQAHDAIRNLSGPAMRVRFRKRAIAEPMAAG